MFQLRDNCNFNTDYSSVARFACRLHEWKAVRMYKRARHPCVKQYFCISNSRCVRLAAHSVSYSYAVSAYTQRGREREHRDHLPAWNTEQSCIVRLREIQVHGHLLLLPPSLPSKFAIRKTGETLPAGSRRRGVLDNAAPFPGAGTTALTRSAFAPCRARDNPAVRWRFIRTRESWKLAGRCVFEM